MLVILIVLIVAAAAYVIVARRQSRSGLLETRTTKHIDGERLRPLFAPDEEELRAMERAEEDAAKKLVAEEERFERAEKLASFEEFRQTWRKLPDRMNTIELFSRAAELESGEVFVEAVDEVLHERRPTGWSDLELADLIESHFRLLPLEERTPGAGYTITQELAALRGNFATTSEVSDN